MEAAAVAQCLPWQWPECLMCGRVTGEDSENVKDHRRQGGKFTSKDDEELVQGTPVPLSVGKFTSPSWPQRDAKSSRRTSGEPAAQGSTDLRESLQVFQALADKGVRASAGGAALVPLVIAACRLVEALVSGIHEHLPQVEASSRVNTSMQPEDCPGTVEAQREVAVIMVRFEASAPLVGEIGTRSRVPLSVRVQGDLRFAICIPPAQSQPALELRVDGLEMPVLEDALSARTRLREDLGKGLNPMSAYAWWEKHRHKDFPLQHSKFHRVVESLLEQKGMKIMGTKVCADSFWGYLHTTDLSVEVFEFHIDDRTKSGVAMTARMRAPKSPAESDDRAKVKDITVKMLKNNRASADKLCPSAISVGAMLAGPEVGQPGACPNVVAKLFTAARWWGRGEDAWHRHDESWLCTDKKDWLGRMVEEQGRLIWRLAEVAWSPTHTAKSPIPQALSPSANGLLPTLKTPSGFGLPSLCPGSGDQPPAEEHATCSAPPSRRSGKKGLLARLQRRAFPRLSKHRRSTGGIHRASDSSAEEPNLSVDDDRGAASASTEQAQQQRSSRRSSWGKRAAALAGLRRSRKLQGFWKR